MKITPVALLSLAGASTIFSFQDSASASIGTNSSIPNSDECDIVAEREGKSVSSSICSISRQESVADFELTELVKLVEFSNTQGQKRSSSNSINRNGLPLPRPDRLMVVVERSREI